MIKLIPALFLFILVVACRDQPRKNDNESVSGLPGSAAVKGLRSPADTGSAQPFLFTDKNGQVYLSWIEKRSGKSWLKFARLIKDAWSAPKTIQSGNNWFVNWADYPLLASDGDGNILAHFLEKSEMGKYTYDVKWLQSGDEGSTWSAPTILHDDGKKAEHGFVSIIPYKNDFFLSWLDGRNTVTEGHEEGSGEHHGQMTLRAAVIDKKGNKTAEWELDGKVCDCCQTSATLTANGPVVVYRDRSDSGTRDISIVRLVNNQWTAPKTIYPDNWKIDGCPVNGPRIAAQGNTVAVAWFTASHKDPQVKIAFSTDGGATFTPPVRVDEGKTSGRVAIVLPDEEHAIVCWMEGPLIKFREVTKNGKLSAPVIVAKSSESRASGFPQMTRSGEDIFFAWTDEKEKRVKSARFHP